MRDLVSNIKVEAGLGGIGTLLPTKEQRKGQLCEALGEMGKGEGVESGMGFGPNSLEHEFSTVCPPQSTLFLCDLS